MVPQWNCSVYIQISQPSLFSHPPFAKNPLLRDGAEDGLPNPTQRFNQISMSLSMVNLRMYTGEVLETWLI